MKDIVLKVVIQLSNLFFKFSIANLRSSKISLSLPIVKYSSIVGGGV
jgi:hypothetical protein